MLCIIIKIPALPKLIYTFNAFLIEMLVDVCMCICKLTSRFYFAEIAEENGKNMEKMYLDLYLMSHTHTQNQFQKGLKV